jgi:ribose transport system substrate-binding protein
MHQLEDTRRRRIMVKPASGLGRRLVGLLAVGAVAGVSSGCGGAQPGRPADPVAYVAQNLSRSFTVAIAAGFRSGVATVPGVRQQVVAPPADNDPVGQADLFERMLTATPGGISVSMSAPERFVDCLTSAAAKHVPVIAVDVPPPPGAPVGLYVGNDNHELGTQLADLVIDRLPPDAHGTVLLGSPRPGVPVLDLRTTAVRAEFHARRPGVAVLGAFDIGQRSDSSQAWRQLLAANPHPLAMLSVGADGASLAQVRRATKGTWLAAAFDLDAVSLAAVKRGELLLMSPEHFLKGAIAGRLQAEHADHRSPLPRGWIYTAGLAVTPKNIDSILERESSAAATQAWFAADLDRVFGPNGPPLRDLNQVS